MSTPSLRLAAVFTVLAAASLCSPASAQSSTPEKPRWNVGTSAVWSPSLYRNYSNKAWLLPAINYEGRSFYFRGASMGYRLLNSSTNEVSILVSPMGNRFRHDDSNDPRLRRLSDRDVSGMAGFAWRHRADWDIVQARVQKEFTGHGGGSMLDLNYSYPVVKGRLSLLPVLGMSYNNSALNDYYYAITDSPMVDANHTVSYFASLSYVF